MPAQRLFTPKVGMDRNDTEQCMRVQIKDLKLNISTQHRENPEYQSHRCRTLHRSQQRN